MAWRATLVPAYLATWNFVRSIQQLATRFISPLYNLSRGMTEGFRVSAEFTVESPKRLIHMKYLLQIHMHTSEQQYSCTRMNSVLPITLVTL